MTAAERLSGVFAAAITPLDRTGRPDPEAAARYCARLIDDGCDGINLLGTTGEAVSFSVAERIAIMEAVARSVAPARCMVGTGASAFDDSRVLTRAALELGYAGALVIPPFYYKALSEDEVFAWYARLIETIADERLALYLYHFPALSGVPLTLPLIERLVARYPQTIAGLKDSEGASGYAESLATAHPKLAIFPSSETRLRDAATCGFAGCISATVQVVAPLARDVRIGASNAAAAHDALVAIRATIVGYGTIAAVRAVAAQRFGVPEYATPALPLAALSDERAAALARELAAIPAFSALAAPSALLETQL
jgi:4-hydroxy-tetrahydrodipicolinate synthase